MIKNLLIIATLISLNSFGQEITVNTQNKIVNTNHLTPNKSTYLVYFQDGPNTPKYNVEIWDRGINIDNKNRLTINWLRQSHEKTHNYTIIVDNNFKPISEEILIISNDKNINNEIRKYFIFKDDNVITHKDSTKHNQKAFSINNTSLAFNWELDLETLSLLPLEDYESFKINFYHPGSKTEPKYYIYKKVRTEKILFNEKPFDCWVLKIGHNRKQWSEFWFDKKTKKVLQMRDFFYGKFRYKKLVI